MMVLTTVVYVSCAACALLAAYYAARDLSADLVLLGAVALVMLTWLVQALALGWIDLTGGHDPDPVTFYGYLLTGLALPVGAGWAGVFERSRWGSVVIAVAAVTMAVLNMRLPQIWSGGFS